MNTPTLETERLMLRKFTEEDIKALFLILKDEDVNKKTTDSLSNKLNTILKDVIPAINPDALLPIQLILNMGSKPSVIHVISFHEFSSHTRMNWQNGYDIPDMKTG